MRTFGRAVSIILLAGCGGAAPVAAPPVDSKPVTPSPQSPITPATPPTYDVDGHGIPRFASANYIELAPISRISRFRSAFGHDYADAFETCRTMKHYFQPRSNVDWSSISIFAPVDGTIESLRAETTFGTQIAIRSSAQPAFRFIIFHVKPLATLDSGKRVAAGERLGSHIGSATMSDLAVGVETPAGYKLISWFDVMTDELFATYQARGVTTRGAAVISRSERDANRLTCTGETYVGGTSLETWVVLD